MSGMRERKKRQTRKALIASARKLFALSGFEGAAMHDIAADADVSTPSLYNYFSSKDRLLAAIIYEDVENAITSAETIVKSDPCDPLRAYLDLLKAYFSAFDQIDRQLLRRFTAHAIGLEDQSDIEYFNLESDLFDQIKRLTQLLVEKGILKSSAVVGRIVFSVANSEFYAYVTSDSANADAALDNIRIQLEHALT